ncbi:MAG: gamma-glutamyl-gamma-aminobutyrate hydrolase family protein [Anaerolineae bacterium]|nr:gamma-glutamyl-gamma-aminobutyrate hydrolase family protein [Phycisphaerae bacterium]
MNRPLIGITTDYNDKRTSYSSYYTYAESVERGGGLPLLIPHRLSVELIPQIVSTLQGIVFSGGDDLNPSCYGECYCDGTEPIDPARETFERGLLAEVEKRKLPTLGICLGSQLMNCARGGSLIQYLPGLARDNATEHRKLGDESRRHDISLHEGTTLAKHLGKQRVIVNTSHKQSVKAVGRGLRVIATSPDGVIEGIEDPSMPLFLGVQWHPERMTDERDHLAIFELLVSKSRNGK